MRKVAGHLLWIGHAGDLLDPRTILDAGIEAVVELADSEPLADLPRSLIRCRFPISDDGENPPGLLSLALRTIADLIDTDLPTLIACSAGMSRSVTLAAAAIATSSDTTLEDTLRRVIADGPADLSPGLLAQVVPLIGPPRGDSSGLRRATGKSNQASS